MLVMHPHYPAVCFVSPWNILYSRGVNVSPDAVTDSGRHLRYFQGNLVSVYDVSLVLYMREPGRTVDAVFKISVDSNQGGAGLMYGRTLLICTQRAVQAMPCTANRICTQRSVSVYVSK